jgi:mono/diheme cytochrome c family protein
VGSPGVVLVLLAVLLRAVPAGAAGDAERGKVIFALAGGCGCHTAAEGPVGAGGRRLDTPFGTFFGTNITPDAETGLGRWSDREIIAAIRDGDARGRGVEAPVMPYYLYAGMADRDVRDLVAYLRTLPAASRANRPAEVHIPFARLAYRMWRWLFTTPAAAPAEPPEEAVARGRYLADHVSICTDCHTPRNRLGALREEQYLAGSARGPDGRSVPNITPDVETGIGDWDAADLTRVLRLGMLPDFDNVQGLMAEVVDGYGGGPGYSDAPEGELRAIAAYLKTVPAVRNAVERD